MVPESKYLLIAGICFDCHLEVQTCWHVDGNKRTAMGLLMTKSDCIHAPRVPGNSSAVECHQRDLCNIPANWSNLFSFLLRNEFCLLEKSLLRKKF
jgi:hypothetical protein